MYDNTFAAGRTRYKNRFYFSVFMTLNFIHFTPRGTCILILLNKTNECFILFLYCHQLISFEDKTKQLYEVSKCRENMLSKKWIYKKFNEYNTIHQEDVISQGVTTVGQLRKNLLHPSHLTPDGRGPWVATFLFQAVNIRYELKFSHSLRNIYINLWLVALFSCFLFLGAVERGEYDIRRQYVERPAMKIKELSISASALLLALLTLFRLSTIDMYLPLPFM